LESTSVLLSFLTKRKFRNKVRVQPCSALYIWNFEVWLNDVTHNVKSTKYDIPWIEFGYRPATKGGGRMPP